MVPFADLSRTTGAVWLGLLAIGFAAAPAIAQDSLESCRKIDDKTARFDCYERIPVAPAQAAPVAAATNRADWQGPSRGDVLTESSVAASFAGWVPNERITLENGQVWQVVDGSSYATTASRRRAAVKRGAFGADFLDIDGIARAPRVRRIK